MNLPAEAGEKPALPGKPVQRPARLPPALPPASAQRERAARGSSPCVTKCACFLENSYVSVGATRAAPHGPSRLAGSCPDRGRAEEPAPGTPPSTRCAPAGSPGGSRSCPARPLRAPHALPPLLRPGGGLGGLLLPPGACPHGAHPTRHPPTAFLTATTPPRAPPRLQQAPGCAAQGCPVCWAVGAPRLDGDLGAAPGTQGRRHGSRTPGPSRTSGTRTLCATLLTHRAGRPSGRPLLQGGARRELGARGHRAGLWAPAHPHTHLVTSDCWGPLPHPQAEAPRPGALALGDTPSPISQPQTHRGLF